MGGITLLVTLLVMAYLSLASAHAGAESDPPLPSPGDKVVTVETLTEDGELVSIDSYGPETEGQLMGGADSIPAGDGDAPQATGDGGQSSPTGCRRVTVKNKTESTLGFTTYWFNTWTRWCWNRATQVIYGVKRGWALEDVDVVAEWQGVVKKELLFYDFSTNDGHPKGDLGLRGRT